MNVSYSNQAQRVRNCGDGRDEQALVKRAQIKAAIEAIAERCEVTSSVLLEVERMVATREAGLEIAQDSVDPFELRHVLGLASGHYGGLMAATGIRHGTEAGQAIGEHDAPRYHIGLRPRRNGFAREAGHRRQAYAQRAILIGQGNGSDKRHLVLGTPPHLAPRALTAEIGIIHLNFAFKEIVLLPVSHDLHQLVVDQPCRGVAHAQLSPERQGRQPGLGLADQVDRQEPGGQRQFRTLKDGAGNQRGLMAAGGALKDFARAVTEYVVRGFRASRATKPLRPAGRLKSLLALCLGSVVLEKFRHRQPRLKLNSVHRHDLLPRVG